MSAPDVAFNTVQLHHCVELWRSGDRRGAEELFRAVGLRLEKLARKMLRTFPTVRRWAETADVFQGAGIRLMQALHTLEPASTRDFFNLAALQMRRELLDLARRFSGQRATYSLSCGSGNAAIPEPQAPPPADDLETWHLFHQAVEKLPTDEREVIGLTFYHGWTQPQIADLFQVDVRTVRRRWQSACLRLNELVGGILPTP